MGEDFYGRRIRAKAIILLFCAVFVFCAYFSRDGAMAIASTDQEEHSAAKNTWLEHSPESQDAAAIVLTSEERAWLKAHPDIRLGFTDALPPSVIVSEEGEYSGIYVDFLNELNKCLGTHIRLQIESIADILEKVKTRQVDGLIALHPEYSDKLGLSKTRGYISVYPTVFARFDTPFRGPDDFSGKKVALLDKVYFSNYIIREYGDRADIFKVSTSLEGFQKIQNGEADYFISSSRNRYLLRKYRLSEIAPKYTFFDYSAKFGMAIRPDWPMLVAILNKAIDSFPQEEVDGLVAKWVELPEQKEVIALTAEERAWLGRHPRIVLGGAILPPLDFVSDNGKRPAGLGPDFTDYIGRTLGISFEYVSGSWQEMLAMAREKKIDGIRLLVRNKEREEYLNFSIPYEKVAYAIVTVKNSTYASLDGLSHQRVGVMDGGHAFHYLQQQYPEITLVRFPFQADAVRALINGDVEAVVGALAPISYQIDKLFITRLKVGAFLSEMGTDLHIGIRKDWPELATILNKAIAAVSEARRKEIKKKWIFYDKQDHAEPINLSEKERAWLARNPTVRVGLADYPPTISVKGGKPFGIAIDILDRVSERTGIQFRYDTRPVPYSERLKGVMEHSGPDLLPSLQRDPERENRILFTEAYLSNPRFIFTRDDAPFVDAIDELSGKTVAVERGFLVQKWLADDYPDINVLPCKKTKDALEALSSGKAAAYIGPLRATASMINQFGFSNLKAAAPSGLPDGIVRMGIRNDWPELQAMINKVLDSLAPEEKAAIINRWTTVKFEHGIRPGDVLKWLLLVGAAAAGTVLWFVFWNRTLKKKVRDRTADLAAEVDERKAAENALAEKEAQALALINAVSSPFFLIDNDGAIIVANQGLADQIDKDITRLIGSNAYDLIPESLARSRRVHVEKAIASGRALTFTDIRSGRFIESRMYPLIDDHGAVKALAVLATDITEKIEAQQMIEASEARFRATFEQAAVGIAHVGTDGRFLRINRKFCSIVGYPESELLERTFQDITCPEDLDSDLDHVRQLLAGEKSNYALEKRYLHRDGGTIWVNLTVSLMRDEAGEPQHFVSVIEDISRRKQAEDKIREYQERLKAMASQLTLAEEKERRAIAADLHDHVGHSLALARMQLSTIPEASSKLETNLLVKDVSNILLKALQDTRSLIFELSSPSMNEIGLAAAISEWLEDHIGRRHHLQTEFIENIREDRIKGLDENVRALLFRNVRELLANVVKHARADKVRVCLTDEGDGVRIIVEDDGAGFDFSASGTRKSLDGGFGLFSIQERMSDLGGTFEIASEPGKGCRAVLTVPGSAGRETE